MKSRRSLLFPTIGLVLAVTAGGCSITLPRIGAPPDTGETVVGPTASKTTASPKKARPDPTVGSGQEVGFSDFIAGEDLLIGRDFENSIVKTLWETDYIPEIQQVDLAGTLNYMVADFDDDGDDELLVIRIGQLVPPEFGETVAAVTAHMYEAVGGDVTEADSAVLADTVLAGADEFIDVAVSSADNGHIIFCEHKMVGVISDGVDWTFRSFTYERGSFRRVDSHYFAGSYFDEETMAEIEIAQYQINERGVRVEEIIERRIRDANPDASVLASIDVEVQATQDEIVDFMQTEDATRIPITISIRAGAV